MSFRAKTFSAIRWVAVGVAVKILLQFLQVVILARILAPKEIGALSIALSITAFIVVFVDVGISNAIIHQQRISSAERSALYWLNLLIGGLVALIFAAISPWVAEFYGEPVLRDVLLILSPYFFVFAAGQQLKVMAEKDLMFGRLIMVEVAAALIGFCITIGCAWAGSGARSVAIGQLFGAGVFTVLAWRYLAMGWRPEIRFDFQGVRRFVRYGMYVVGNSVVSSVNGTADVFLAGKVVGLGALGGFSLARDLMLNVGAVINAIVTRVGLPVMAKAQDQSGQLKNVYLKTLRMTASVNMPIFMAVLVLAPEVVHVVFGERWVGAAPLLRWLAIWGMLRAIGQPVGSLIFSVGRADLALKWNVFWTGVMIPAWWLGLQYGLSGLAKTMVIVSLIGQVPNWWFLVKPLCGARFTEYFSQLVPPLVASSLAAAGSLLSLLIVGEVNVYARLGIGMVVGAIGYLVSSAMLNRDWMNYLWQAAVPGRSRL